ncbi:MAG: hypothetical protein IJ060_05470 [Oscillospiraceae bacterium]|nr:hypothetical protein [Oscillospiraceae bacterium]
MLLTIFLAVVFCAAISLLMKSGFFQHYFPETAPALANRKYGFNIISQLVKLLIIFPAASALAAWICTLFQK